jgi:hypothetical protein
MRDFRVAPRNSTRGLCLGVNVIWTSANVPLLDGGHPHADGGFDFSRCIHAARAHASRLIYSGRGKAKHGPPEPSGITTRESRISSSFRLRRASPSLESGIVEEVGRLTNEEPTQGGGFFRRVSRRDRMPLGVRSRRLFFACVLDDSPWRTDAFPRGCQPPNESVDPRIRRDETAHDLC